MKQISIFIAMAATVAVQCGGAQTSAVLTDRAAARFLDQATWGPTPASIAQLQQTGIIAWLNAQFALNTSDLPDQPLLGSDGKPDRDLTPVQAAFFQNAVTGQDQLRQRVAFALSQMWVVSAVSTKVAYAFPPYWRLFRDNAFGNYRDIMKAVTLSPAMGNYLNMANNNKGNAAKGTSANENYARELMQLFTVGLTQLDLNGNPVLDSSNNPVPTYDQSVVTNTARALTGWTYPTAPNATAKTNNPQYYLGPMHAVEAGARHHGEDHHRRRHHSRWTNGGAGSGVGAGRADGTTKHGSVREQATDPAPGDQRPQPGLRAARGRSVSG